MSLFPSRCSAVSATLIQAILLFAVAGLASPAFAHASHSNTVFPVASRAQEHALPRQWSRLLHDHEWSRLDSIAARLRSQRLRFQGGGWQLHVFYCDIGTGCLDPAGAQWRWRVSALKEWIHHSPASPTPRIALADAYEEMAWEARGNGEADTVSPQAWTIFYQRVKLARDTLDASQQIGRNDPGWYDAMLHVALDQGWHAGMVQEFANAAISKFPGYFYLVRDVAKYFLPQWYGMPGNTAKYVELASNSIGGEQGDATYFFVAEILLVEEDNCYSCKTPVMSWHRIRRGFNAVQRLYGTNNYEFNTLAFLALHDGDRRTARMAFKEIGNRWDNGVWASKLEFENAHLFAKARSVTVAPSQ